MKISDLRPAPGAHKSRHRVGRGIAAGQGKTAGRGTKGQGARKNGTKAPYFEGGQLPLVRRLPFKRGFTNLFRVVHQEVNLDTLQKYFPQGGDIQPQMLVERGLIRDANEPIVIMGRGAGDFKLKVTVHAHRITASAQETIEKAGGTVNKLPYLLTGAKATIRRPRKAEIEKLRAQASQQGG
jgi:large subunit ribosomal protein L15